MNSGTRTADDRSLAAGPEDQGEFRVRTYFRWSPEEEDELRRAVELFGRRDWELMRTFSEFKLLRYRSATMLKNKWYKMMRSERSEEPQLTSAVPTAGSEGPTRAFSGLCPVTPRKRMARCLSMDLDISVDDVHAGMHEQQPDVKEATKQLNDALATLREALAIQVDANKAAAASVAARDDGTCDDDTVRTAMYVATLAQKKAKRARHNVSEAKQHHAAAVAADAAVRVCQPGRHEIDALADVTNGFDGFEVGSHHSPISCAAPGQVFSDPVQSSRHTDDPQLHKTGICDELAMLFGDFDNSEAHAGQYINLSPKSQQAPQPIHCAENNSQLQGGHLPLRLSPPQPHHYLPGQPHEAFVPQTAGAADFCDILPCDASALQLSPPRPRSTCDPSSTGPTDCDVHMSDAGQSLGAEVFAGGDVKLDIGGMAPAEHLNDGNSRKADTEFTWAEGRPEKRSEQPPTLGYGFCHGFWEMDMVSTTTTVPHSADGFLMQLTQ